MEVRNKEMSLSDKVHYSCLIISQQILLCVRGLYNAHVPQLGRDVESSCFTYYIICYSNLKNHLLYTRKCHSPINLQRPSLHPPFHTAYKQYSLARILFNVRPSMGHKQGNSLTMHTKSCQTLLLCSTFDHHQLLFPKIINQIQCLLIPLIVALCTLNCNIGQ